MKRLLEEVAMSSLDRHRVVMYTAQQYLHNVLIMLSYGTSKSKSKNTEHGKIKV